jgi:hypothetical protein
MFDPETDPAGVYALVGDFKVKLAEWSACEVLPADAFPAGVPDSARAAVQGGDYLMWAIATDTGVDFYSAHRSTLEQEGYSRIATYRGGRFDLLRPLHAADLAGYYTHAGSDTSYVLFVGMDGGQLIGKLFATTEALPTPKMLQRALPTFAATPELPFQYDLNTLDFQSALGKGTLSWETDSAQLHFTTFMGQQKEIHFTALR